MPRPRTGCCSNVRCKVSLTKENTSPGVLKLGHGRCRQCSAELLKDWRNRNKKRCLENQKANRAKKAEDPAYVEERRQKQKLYDIKRRNSPHRKEEKRLRYRKRVETDLVFVEEQKARLAAYYQTPEGKHAALKRVLKTEGVQNTDVLWSINFYRELILDGCCHYCLGPLKSGGHSLDRMENKLGHVCYNVVPCCRYCNELKGVRFSYEEMMLLVPSIRDIRNRREVFQEN
jgi:hypothetical protein